MKIAKYLLFATVVLASCSTEDFLNEQPQLTIPLNGAITNEAQLKVGVNGLYNNLQSISTYGGRIATLSDLLADQAFVSLSNSNRFALTRQADLTFYTKFNGDISGIWSALYSTIVNSNLVLSTEGDAFADDPAVAGTPDDYYAQAHAIRAMCYFDLITLFAEYPGAGDQNLGVPLQKTVAFGSALPRASIAEIYDFIFADLSAANAKITNTNNKQTFNKAAVDLLLSRYYLAKKDYPNANIFAQKVLDDTSSTLLTQSGVSTFWTVAGESNPEVIFAVDFNSNDLPGANDAIIATWWSGGTYKQNFATQSFYNSFSTTDVRRGSWYSATGATGVNLTSYPDNPKPIDVKKYITIDRDVVVMRKTEAIFNQLEALYYTNPSSAVTKLNTWMTAYRDVNYSFSGSGSAVLDEILKQKNKEFMLEGFRYRDLKRNGISFTNPQTGVSLSPSNYQFQAFPIPEGEMNTNSNMVQNPGY